MLAVWLHQVNVCHLNNADAVWASPLNRGMFDPSWIRLRLDVLSLRYVLRKIQKNGVIEYKTLSIKL